MILSLANRKRLLAFAAWLDRRAAGVRAFVRATTPKRGKRLAEDDQQKLPLQG